MAHKLTIEPQSVQETMLLPVWGRAKYSHLYPELLDDPRAGEIMGKIGYDFSKVKKGSDENDGLAYLVRAGNFDDAIDFRKKLIPKTSRCECIAKSAFNISWFDDVEYEEDKGIYVIAGGIFHYFEESEIRRLVSSMAEKFPDGEMIFDAVSKASLWFTNRMVKKTGNIGAEVYFSLGNPVKQISKWSDNIEVAKWHPYWHDIKRDPRGGTSTIFKMNFCDWFKMAKFVHTMKKLPEVDVGFGYLYQTLLAPIRSKLLVAAIEPGPKDGGTFYYLLELGSDLLRITQAHPEEIKKPREEVT